MYNRLAAFITGGYIMLETSETKAQEAFEDIESRQISPKDRAKLLELLRKPPEPNSVLRQAYDKVLKAYKTESDYYEIEDNLFGRSQV